MSDPKEADQLQEERADGFVAYICEKRQPLLGQKKSLKVFGILKEYDNAKENGCGET